MSNVANIGTLAAATIVICGGEPDPADEYSAACFDPRELHDVCAGTAKDDESCICPCHNSTASQEDRDE